MADKEKNDTPKIIVDEDWKHQAQKNKETVQEKTETDAAEQQKQARALPEGNFSSLVSMLATQTMFALGLIEAEKGKKPEADLTLAKFQIDILEMLQEKTKDNLSEDEEKMLNTSVSQLRMAYVQVSG